MDQCIIQITARYSVSPINKMSSSIVIPEVVFAVHVNSGMNVCETIVLVYKYTSDRMKSFNRYQTLRPS